MLIQLKCDVQVRTPEGKFVTIKAESHVNYSSTRRDGAWVHRFSVMLPKTSTIVTHIEVTSVGQPEWL